jgi:putative transposase
MPNHFHFLIHANDRTVAPWYRQTWDGKFLDTNSGIHMSQFSRGLQLCLSSYAKAINNQYKRSGSLFTQNTHSRQTSSEFLLEDYSAWCFMYIHNNPVIAGLASSPEKWPYSSYREYAGDVTNRICNVELGQKLLRLDLNPLSSYSQAEIPDFIRAKIL